MLKGWKVREVIKRLLENGWFLERQSGSDHKVFKHENWPKLLSIPGKPGDTVSPGIMSQIRRNAGLHFR